MNKVDIPPSCDEPYREDIHYYDNEPYEIHIEIILTGRDCKRLMHQNFYKKMRKYFGMEKKKTDMNITKIIKDYVKKKNISIAKLSDDSGIGYNKLYDSLGDAKRKRELRADELISICRVLHIDPMKMADEGEETKN